MFSALAQRFTPPQANARSLSILDRFRSLRLLRWKYRLSGWKAQGKPLAELPPAEQQLVKTLQRQGGAQTSLAALGLPLTPDLFQAAQTLAGQLPSSAAHSNSHLGHCIHGDAATIVQRYPEILLWGLQERLLDIVENYMQLPVAYLGVDLRKDIPNGEQVGTRFWHTDSEDVCVVKIAVYLNDVGQAQGPFEYISKTEFNASYRYLSPTYLSKNLRRPLCNDQDMSKIVPRQRWTSCVGPSGTVVIVDTTHVLHHGAVPTEERIALFFAYATRTPQKLAFCKELFPVEPLLPSLRQRLSPRQWDCLWGWRQMPEPVVQGQPLPATLATAASHHSSGAKAV